MFPTRSVCKTPLSGRRVLTYPGINLNQANAPQHFLCEPRSRVCNLYAFPSLTDHQFDHDALDREADNKDCERDEARGSHVINEETKSDKDLF
jgi:hypothetical protein